MKTLKNGYIFVFLALQEVHIFLPAHTLDEITEERICTLAYNAAVVTKGPRGRPGRRMEDGQAIVVWRHDYFLPQDFTNHEWWSCFE